MLQTEVALVYDAVRLFAQTLYEIDKNGMQLKPPEDVSCESENAWKYGTIVSNYMRNVNSATKKKVFKKNIILIFLKQIEMDGITGPIKFDFTGSRSDFRLQLLELTREGLKHVGDWQPHKKITFMSNYTKAMTEIYRESLRNKTLTIVTIGVNFSQRTKSECCSIDRFRIIVS